MKMIQFKYAIISTAFLLGGMTTGCDTLDIDNLETYDESMVWGDLNLAQAYVNNLYEECFEGWSVSADQNSDQVTGIPWYLGTITETGDSYKKWDYTKIRHINEAIFKLESSVIEDKDAVDFMLGQAYFMRAYMYYWMVLHHGGVPYLKVPQDKDKDDLYVKRNSTPECFQFMIEDLDHAISLLPAKIAGSSSDYGRIDQCFAKSWKAKTLLLKASPQFNPKRMYDNAYWKEAYVAAKEAYDFCVQNGIALTENPADIWLQEKGPEVIFPVIYSNPNRVATWEYGTRPASVSRDKPYHNPTWEFVKDFPMLDGKRYDDPTGKYYVGDEQALLKAFWKNRDPRFNRACLYNGREWPVAGRPADNRMYNALGVSNADDQYGVNPNAGVNAANNDIFSGMYNYKVSDLSLTQDKVMTFDIDYILMRFAEVMFIYAEAANENGHSDVAIDLLKQIRKRAGINETSSNPEMKGKVYGLNPNMNQTEMREAVREERFIELLFEQKRLWDMRRWMIYDNLMNGQGKRHALVMNKQADNTYTTYLFDRDNTPMITNQNIYFLPMKRSEMSNNPNLEQTKGWENGTFDPQAGL